MILGLAAMAIWLVLGLAGAVALVRVLAWGVRQLRDKTPWL